MAGNKLGPRQARRPARPEFGDLQKWLARKCEAMRVVYDALYIDLTPVVQINLRKRETNLRSFLYPGTNVWVKLFERSERPANVSLGD